MLKLNIEDAKNTLIEKDFPMDVIFETTSTCNLKCIMCPQNQIRRIGKVMDIDLFKKGAKEIALESPETRIWFAQMGEALVEPDNLISMIRYAKALGHDNLHLNTNGGLLTTDISKQLVESGISNIYFGLDAFDTETYDKIRCEGDYTYTVNAINDFVKINKAAGTPVKVAVQFIVMDENIHQQDSFKEYWLGQGAIVKIRPRLGWGDAYDSDGLYLGENERDYPCPWLIRVMQIQVDGTIIQCGGDWDGQYPLANIKDRTIKSVWNCELKELRNCHWASDFSKKPCCDCKDWQTGRSYYYQK